MKPLTSSAFVLFLCLLLFSIAQTKITGSALTIKNQATYYAFKKQTAKVFRKSFYERQLQYYAEAAEATATLATKNIGTEDYIKAKKTFCRLFWGGFL